MGCDDIHVLISRLADAAYDEGLEATVIAPTRVKIRCPGAHSGFTEVIRAEADAQGLPWWVYSWGERICMAHEIDQAVKAIKQVVTPPALT
jgi:hypothetical protein